MNQLKGMRNIGLLLLMSLWLGASGNSYGEDTEQAAEGAGDAPAADAAAAPPPPPKNPPLPLDLQRGKLLAEQFSQEKEKKASVTWFREGQKDAFLGLYTENYGREPQGYALILHDNQQHPDWPGVVNYLRTQLPATGWSTLSISLPITWQLTDAPPREKPVVMVETPGNKAPDASSESDPAQAENTMAAATATMDAKAAAENGANGEPEKPAAPVSYTQLSVEYPPEDIPDIIQGRIGDALSFLQGKDPMPIVVIAIGTSATYTAKQVHNLRMKDIAGLVIVDPKAVPLEDFNVSNDAPGLRIPVLDLVPEFFPRTDPAARLRAARREGRQSYEQQIIAGADPGFRGYETVITKAIRGWARRVILDKKRFGYL